MYIYIYVYIAGGRVDAWSLACCVYMLKKDRGTAGRRGERGSSREADRAQGGRLDERVCLCVDCGQINLLLKTHTGGGCEEASSMTALHPYAREE